MTCPDCENLQKRVKELEEENAELKRKLAFYENPHTPPSKRIYPYHKPRSNGKRFPGRPKGHMGKTRLRPKPEL